MSATVQGRRRITVTDVKAALDAVVDRDPSRTDRRVEAHLNPRYLDQGQPHCLIAHVLLELGYTEALLRDLDRECPTGHVAAAGVRVAESRHPALRRLAPTALALLQHLQRQQDRGFCWGTIAEDAFRPRGMFSTRRSDAERRPWLYP